MYRRYRDYRHRRRRTTDRRPRSILKRPGVQIAILVVVALVIYLILQSGGAAGNSLPHGSTEWQMIMDWHPFLAKLPAM